MNLISMTRKGLHLLCLTLLCAVTASRAAADSGTTTLATLSGASTSISHFIYVSTTGNDKNGARGNPAKPYKTIYGWDGKTNHPPTGAVTMATNGDIIVILNEGAPYYIPAFPIFNRGVTVIGIGKPTVYRTNATGQLETDESTAGPFLQPNDDFTISGVNIVATNGINRATLPYWDVAFGNDDDLLNGNISVTNCGFTNIVHATNFLAENCSFTGECYGIYFNVDYSGSTNIGTFRNCTINSWSQGAYSHGATLPSQPAFHQIYFDHCHFNVTANTSITNIVNSATYKGIGQALHILGGRAGAQNFYDTGSTLTVFGTNTTSDAQMTAFIKSERQGQIFYLNGTQFVLSSKQTSNFVDITYFDAPTNSVTGWYLNTNGVPVILNGTNLDGASTNPQPVAELLRVSAIANGSTPPTILTNAGGGGGTVDLVGGADSAMEVSWNPVSSTTGGSNYFTVAFATPLADTNYNVQITCEGPAGSSLVKARGAPVCMNKTIYGFGVGGGGTRSVSPRSKPVLFQINVSHQ